MKEGSKENIPQGARKVPESRLEGPSLARGRAGNQGPFLRGSIGDIPILIFAYVLFWGPRKNHYHEDVSNPVRGF